MPPLFLSKSNGATGAMTLVELLVVLGIIAVLAALVLSASQTFFDRGKDTKCLSNHRSIIQATMLYAADHDGTLPGNGNDGPGFSSYKLSPYLGVKWTNNSDWHSLWFCPSRASGFEMYPFSNYAFSVELFGLGAGGTNRMPIKIAAIEKPSKNAAFACVIGNYGIFHTFAYTHTADPPEANLSLGQLAPWHRGGTVISFMDGHSEAVEAFSRKDNRRHWFSLNHPKAP